MIFFFPPQREVNIEFVQSDLQTDKLAGFRILCSKPLSVHILKALFHCIPS